MATQEVISLVVDKIVQAFDADVALFEAFLTRSRLETEAATLQSARRSPSETGRSRLPRRKSRV